jgi:cytochrome oxidase Cu insertion factor (SCO1/SenC/PrrC family)
MTRLLTVIAIILVAAEAHGNNVVVDVTPQRERTVASINWIDDTGRARQLSEFAGYPLILLPIYTRCYGACVQNIDRLKQTLAAVSNDPSQFRVLLFSFDAGDTPATLTTYREREKIPLGWSVGGAMQPDIDALLESIGLQIGKAGAEFTHPNALIFLDPNLRIAKWIYGTDYSSADVDRALQIATGRNDWIGQHGDFLYAVLLFGATILCVALVYHLRQFRAVAPSILPHDDFGHVASTPDRNLDL